MTKSSKVQNVESPSVLDSAESEGPQGVQLPGEVETPEWPAPEQTKKPWLKVQLFQLPTLSYAKVVACIVLTAFVVGGAYVGAMVIGQVAEKATEAIASVEVASLPTVMVNTAQGQVDHVRRGWFWNTQEVYSYVGLYNGLPEYAEEARASAKNSVKSLFESGLPIEEAIKASLVNAGFYEVSVTKQE